jgi:RNA polymerase sigma-70 factor (ECF subfamily)
MADHVQNITEYIPHLRRYAFSLTYDADEAEDLVQESLLRTISKCRYWSKIRRPRAYLFSILHNLHIDRRKKAKTIADKLRLLNDAEADRISIDPTIAYDCRQALQRIPPNQLEVILFIAVEGLTYDETAAALGIPVGTVMSRLSRGRRALRKHFGERTGGKAK